MNKTQSLAYRYKVYRKKKILFMIIVTILLFISVLTGLSVGSSSVKISDILSNLLSLQEISEAQIILNIRLPRVLAAILTGMALSLSGTAMQSLLRNPLASPVSLGISHAAVFGAAFAIILLGAGTTQSHSKDAVVLLNPYIVGISAFIWALINTTFILLIARFKDSGPETIILSGIICGSLFIAGTSALQYFANDIQVSAVTFWMFGNMDRAAWRELIILAGIVGFTLFYFIKKRWQYNAMHSGDETALSLGVNVGKTRIHGMIVASLATAVAVSFFGVIAFVGLVVPHIVRRFIGNDDRFLLPAATVFGGFFLLVADIIARTVFAPVVLPVGILTSFLGVPLFVYLLMRGKGKML